MLKKNTVGSRGETDAAVFLKKKGYRILVRNFMTKFGEIDIIAKDRNTFCFIEVKSRASDKYGSPEEAVTYPKQKKISVVANCFLKKYKLHGKKFRFDVVSVEYKNNVAVCSLIKDAFETACSD